MADLSLSIEPEPSPRAGLVEARALLEPSPRPREPVWPLLVAAFFAAGAALALAAAVILGPPQMRPAQAGLKPAVSSAERSVEAPGLLGRPLQRLGLV